MSAKRYKNSPSDEDRKVNVSISMPVKMREELKRRKNVSAYVVEAIQFYDSIQRVDRSC